MEKPETSSDGMARRDVLKLAGAAVVGIGGVALSSGPVLGATGGGGAPTVAAFSLAADGITTTFFRDLIELRMAVQRAEDRQGAQPFVAVLRGGARLEPDVYAWFAAALGGKKTAKRAAKITAIDSTGTPLMAWNLAGAIPSEILSSSASTDVLTQITLLADSIVPA